MITHTLKLSALRVQMADRKGFGKGKLNHSIAFTEKGYEVDSFLKFYSLGFRKYLVF